ncbi:hypothetical protein L873DRAFT_1085598 [Choiromyces venosus 120613-1]|uniref:Uncharacterized protein n=1 Tax=Choiromyces venosus 120613-1 TaxID=1336337 RepID=A0A3N4JL61_9PEZI|nr:hypothetical protein L873DRAFT_1085598 [Choiromyces venosus 120613-1]
MLNNTTHNYGGIPSFTMNNPTPAVYYSQPQICAGNILKRARPDDDYDGEDERIPASARGGGMLDGSVAVMGGLGVCSPPNKKLRSKLQLRTHESIPSAQLTVTPPITTTATEASYVPYPAQPPQPQVGAQGVYNNNYGQDMDMGDGLHPPYSVIIGPPTPVSDGGEGAEGDMEMNVEMNEVKEVKAVTRPWGSWDARPKEEKEKRKPLYRMGFVLSCEKCQMRVPGHYGHF